MKVCIIGTGASGWIVCSMLKNLDFIEEIKIIGSNKVPPIGVGESTTLNFVENFLEDVKDFVCESDASVKYGVYYKNWSPNNFIHHFKSHELFDYYNVDSTRWAQTLANKPQDEHIHDYIGDMLYKYIHSNKIFTNKKYYPHSWHFDAAKFIEYLKNKLTKHPKVIFVNDTITGCKFSDKKEIQYIIGENGKQYYANYFINCCGDNHLNQNIFEEEYHDLSKYLLTNKALVYPLKYTNKEKQFHPYTIAKTMNHGWRWITPTQSRIGTGYVFSDNHISIDKATNEFLEDIGDNSITPKLVDFNPRMNKNPFKKNSCVIGMSQGFLEPLDAPGLAITILCAEKLIDLLQGKETIDNLNSELMIEYSWWISFILHQYKTCHRNDTQFWRDQKEVEFDFYNRILSCFYDIPKHLIDRFEFNMLFQTTAGKDFVWESKIKEKPVKILDIEADSISHSDYIRSFYNE